jgi:hypothetical protein
VQAWTDVPGIADGNYYGDSGDRERRRAPRIEPRAKAMPTFRRMIGATNTPAATRPRSKARTRIADERTRDPALRQLRRVGPGPGNDLLRWPVDHDARSEPFVRRIRAASQATADVVRIDGPVRRKWLMPLKPVAPSLRSIHESCGSKADTKHKSAATPVDRAIPTSCG